MNIDKGLRYLSSVDVKMNRLITSFSKPTFTVQENYFSSLVRYIIYQQLSGKSAFAIFNRYKMLFDRDEYNQPQIVIDKPDLDLMSVGLSRQKVSYIKNVGHFFINELTCEDLSKLSDDEIKDCLIQIKGVGPWTINMFLMFTLKREDIMPFSDLGIQKGFKLYFNLNSLPSVSFMIKKSKLWSPYNTLASIYLWYLVDDGFQW
tara:strand:- start:152 stop:763 length:612 start_codon:yes stop_codon:yes gene_type:complete